ncbi:ALG9 [Blepharisma stoltei]|uniref:Mannosyltransferase n=1 Tax=Blepharisma stoltei TaxID=1481888 RepID=A0AAU9K1E6_9CILI|nr:unnamed protein product [Blepharisma stoltei]
MLWISAHVQNYAAFFVPIPDCDEVFNYWDPVHFLVYGKGQEPWEYSPDYALRSYLYLLLHAWPAYILKLFGLSGLPVFYTLRTLIGFFSAYCKHVLIKELNLPNTFYFAMILSTGMVMASHTFIPSAFVMNLLMLAFTYFLKFYKTNSYFYLFLALLCCSFFMIVGWPFAAVIPAAFVVPYLIQYPKFLLDYKLYVLGIAAVLFTTIPSVIIDTYFYGKPVFGIWNLFKYNTSIGSSLVGSSVLFGVDPWYFYIVNLFLNFNIIFLCFLLSPLLLIYSYIAKKFVPSFRFLIALCTCSVAWFLLLSSQPHKEERFMYPIYSGIIILGCYVINSIPYKYLKFMIFGVFLLISFSRTAHLVRSYNAPLKIWSEKLDGRVCVGREWYRFPSSFFLGSADLFYIKHRAAGILPVQFKSTDFVPENMNDLNREEPSRYVDINSCDYIVDINLESDPIDIEFRNWTVIRSETFLDSKSTKQPFRSFYLPFIQKEVLGSYLLMKNPIIN